jgi:hypothetical protein
MDYRLPQGTLSIIEAVNWLAQRRDDEWTIWSVLQQVAWREIRDAVRKEILRAYVLDSAGQSHEADRAQFAALGDQDPMMLSLQEFLATTRRITHFGQTRMLHLLPADREDQVSGKLFFFLNDLKDVFGEGGKAAPSVAVATDEGGSHRETRSALASVTDAEIDDFLKGTGCTNVNVAWLMVKDRWPGVLQKRFRALWRRKGFGASRGRRPKCVGNCVKK